MLSITVHVDHVLDLTDPQTLALLVTTAVELCAPRFPGTDHPALRIGSMAADLGMDALIVPSAVHHAKNLIVFPDAHVMPCYAVVRSIHRL